MTNTILSEYKNACRSCIIYIILLVIFFIKSISISSVFIYFNWYLKKSNANINPGTEAKIYWTYKWEISNKLILKIVFKLTKNRQKFIEKYWYLSHWIHHNRKTDDCENIHSVNPLYLFINKADGYIEKTMEINT